MNFAKILVAIDNSSLASKLFDKALEIAQTEKASIMIFHCLTSDEEVDIDVPIETGSGINIYERDLVLEQPLYQESFNRKIQAVETWLQTYVKRAKTLEIPTEYKHDAGNPGVLICELAKDYLADLIILGRTKHKGFTRFFIGNVSNYVAHHANCSVLIIGN